MNKIVFSITLAAGLLLGGCATLLNSPQDDLTAADAGVAALLAAYEGVCQADTASAICTPAAQAQAKGLEAAITAAINTAQAAINGNISSAVIQSDIQAVVTAVSAFSTFVGNMQAKALAQGVHLPAKVAIHS